MVLYAKDILEPEFLSMRPQTSLLEAAKLMADRHHGFVIVTSPEGRPIGIVTEWDILAKVVAVARNPAQVPLEVPGPVASLEFATARNRPAAPHLARVDRLESGQELDHLGKRPERSLALADPWVLMDEGAVSIAEPFLVVDPDHDRLISQLTKFVAGHDARAQGVRPVLPGSGPHPRFGRRGLKVAGREIVEDRHAEQMRGRLRRVNVPTPDPEA